jgi:hypothetical protein
MDGEILMEEYCYTPAPRRGRGVYCFTSVFTLEMKIKEILKHTMNI